ncbi:hypothetical protein [Janthinobacterium fluminis]|uniref:Uncharacterized protein n=1 Tax=Janthinobacterium fluminis TaxID=2987524 RepID=A0ABT5JWP3_9BURK|nr:hypothetical protein [Janthinobacterium fluminis]MDC8757158.1 hypothetical protein [Janthinobacterium fluminis]
MKDINPPPYASPFKEAGQAFSRFARLTARTLSTMSWPALLLSCIALAIVITIVPLIIALFVGFLLLRWVIRVTGINGGAGKHGAARQ